MIDTSSSLLPDPDSLHMDRTISQQDHDKLEKDIEQITHKIIEKSEFLLSLATPASWLTPKMSQEPDSHDESEEEWK